MSNLLLLNAGYPPAIILKNDRKKYYDALNKANAGDYGNLLLLVLQALERSLDIYLSNLTNTYHDYQPIIVVDVLFLIAAEKQAIAQARASSPVWKRWP